MSENLFYNIGMECRLKGVVEDKGTDSAVRVDTEEPNILYNDYCILFLDYLLFDTYEKFIILLFQFTVNILTILKDKKE